MSVVSFVSDLVGHSKALCPARWQREHICGLLNFGAIEVVCGWVGLDGKELELELSRVT